MPHTTDVWGSEKLQEVTATYLTYRFGNTSVCRTSAMYVRKSEGPSFLLPMVVAESWGGGGALSESSVSGVVCVVWEQRVSLFVSQTLTGLTNAGHLNDGMGHCSPSKG